MAMDSTFEVIAFQIKTLADAQVIALDVRLAKLFWLGKHFVEADARGVAQVSTTLVHLWQSLAVCLALILSWPGFSVKCACLRWFTGCFLLVGMVHRRAFGLIGIIMGNDLCALCYPRLFYFNVLATSAGKRWSVDDWIARRLFSHCVGLET